MALHNRFGFIISPGDIDVEMKQCAEEGKDLRPLRTEAATLKKLDPTQPATQQLYRAFLRQTYALPVSSEMAGREPDDLDRIRDARPPRMVKPGRPCGGDTVSRKLHAAWLGRCAGCLLGKPVEGWRSNEIREFLQAQGRWPLSGYFRGPVPESFAERHEERRIRIDVDAIDAMPEDDDTNYTVLGLAVFEEHGESFTSEDVAAYWLGNLPVTRTFTAERAAMRNFTRGIMPPDSAISANPFREWIGAQIRADFWGYVRPGDPERAAEYAWRDARLSHVKNGIYGEMWVAAMLAAAPALEDPREVIQAGLQEIPAGCRLAQQIERILELHAEGADYDAAVALVHQNWDEHVGHHWCHTISNAAIVAIGLLWGEDDFGRSVCRAVQPGFDTDCNGATVGSVFGLMHGLEAIPEDWTAPLHDRLRTGLHDYPEVPISELANRTAALVTSAD